MKRSTDLDHLLSSPPYLDDDGFTMRVMAHLPKAEASTRSRRGVVLAVSLCATLVGAVMLPASEVALAVVRGVLEPLLTAPLDPVRSGAALMSTGWTALTVYSVVLVMIVGGAVALARSDAQ